jgi:maltose-binding protein MalE
VSARILFASGNAPVDKQVTALPQYAEDPYFAQYIELQDNYGVPMPNWPRTIELYNKLGEELTEAWFGTKTVQEALQAAEDKWNPILEEEG